MCNYSAFIAYYILNTINIALKIKKSRKLNGFINDSFIEDIAAR